MRCRQRATRAVEPCAHPERLPHRLRDPGSAGPALPRRRPGLHRLCIQCDPGAEHGHQRLFGPGDHVITTVCEHNSVLRPLYRLQRQGGEVSFVDVDANGVLCYAQFEQLLRPNTRGVVMTGASNVTGNRTDLAFVSAFAKKHGLLFIVDAAQTAGAMPMDVQALGIDVLCFTGHKALLGPQGTGGLYGPARGCRLPPLWWAAAESTALMNATPSKCPPLWKPER